MTRRDWQNPRGVWRRRTRRGRVVLGRRNSAAIAASLRPRSARSGIRQRLTRVLPIPPGRLRRLATGGLPTLRAAGWALRALRRLRRELPDAGLEVRVAAPPALAGASVRGVELALRLGRATCLERSLVVQRWLLSRRQPRDVLVGVAGGAAALDAHAWIDRYDAAAQGAGYEILTRVGPRA